MSERCSVPGPTAESSPALGALIDKLRRQHFDSIETVLIYGSCLRSGDIYNGLLDIYLISNDYQSAYGFGVKAMANWALPPNVFYEQINYQGNTLRCKYAVVSENDFAKANSPAAFESYFWGRFCQPTCIAWQRNEQARARAETNLLAAVRTFLSRTLPAVADQGTVVDLWREALALSYNTELRTERGGRSHELVTASQDHFEKVTHYATATISALQLLEQEPTLNYRGDYSSARRSLARLAWRLRSITGKPKSILRLVKALFTFAGGLDYIAWKLERHSGQTIVIPTRVKKAPLIFAWGFFWQLYRQGVFK